VAMLGKEPLFWLPGHAVSAAVAWSLFVLPDMRHCAGQRSSFLPEYRTMLVTLMRNINSAAGRTDFVRVRVEVQEKGGEVQAHPVLGKSGALSTLVKAHGFIVIPEKVQGLRKGDKVEVLIFD